MGWFSKKTPVPVHDKAQNGYLPAEHAGGSGGNSGGDAGGAESAFPVIGLYGYNAPFDDAYMEGPYPTEATFGGAAPSPRNTPNYPAYGSFGMAVNAALQRTQQYASMDAQTHPGLTGATNTYTDAIYGPQTLMRPVGQKAQESRAIPGPGTVAGPVKDMAL